MRHNRGWDYERVNGAEEFLWNGDSHTDGHAEVALKPGEGVAISQPFGGAGNKRIGNFIRRLRRLRR